MMSSLALSMMYGALMIVVTVSDLFIMELLWTCFQVTKEIISLNTVLCWKVLKGYENYFTM
jgi:hypothetical protein